MATLFSGQNSIYKKYSFLWRNLNSPIRVGIPFYDKITAQKGDTIYYIQAEEIGRPDLLSQKF